MTSDAHGWTPGPWPMKPAGDHKRILIGDGLVEGPNGYEVAEVYSDDCPWDLAQANAYLIAAAPDLFEALRAARAHVALLGRETDEVACAVLALADAALAKALPPSSEPRR